MATQINDLGLTRLTIAAIAQFHSLIDDEIEVYELPVLHLETLAPQYSAAVASLKAAVNRPTAFSETPEMIEVDHKRDLSVSLAMNIVSAYLKSADEADVEAARRMHALMAPYHGIQGHEYNRETMEIDGLLTVLAAAPVADTTMLGLASAIQHINTYNSKFKMLMVDRTADVNKRTPIADSDSLELRHNCDTLFRDIVTTVNAFAIAIPSAELEAFAKEVNAIIVQYKHVIANQGKGHKEPEEPVVV